MNFLFTDFFWLIILHVVLVFVLYFSTVKKPKNLKISSTLSPVEAIIVCYKRYFDFKGRSSRSEYWWFYLYYNFMFIFSGLAYFENEYVYQLGLGLIILSTIPYLTVKIRRLHDVNESGLSLLAYLIPFGGYWLLFQNLKQGTKGNNHYGKDPLRTN